VQLFDLVEAIDQFFADSQTLPDLSLQLTPAAKHAGSNQSLVKQAASYCGSVEFGVSDRVFFVPIPEVQRPTDPATVQFQSI